MPKFICLFVILLFLQACKHPLAIEGEGDIVERLVGQRGCTLEEFQSNGARCTENAVVGESYQVSYEGVAREGWRFYRWDGTGCAVDSELPFCEYDIAREFVDFINEANEDAATPPTTAVFIQTPPLQLNVPGNAVGGFGPFLGGVSNIGEGDAMVAAVVLMKGETIIITAEGEVNLNANQPNLFVAPPEGLDFNSNERPSELYYFPLEEARVDSGEFPYPIPLNDSRFNVVAAGSLMAAFVLQNGVVKNSFTARNDDPDPNFFAGPVAEQFVDGGIPAENLFFVGSGPTQFEAPEDGVLFLGINDSTGANNSGEFVVSISTD